MEKAILFDLDETLFDRTGSLKLFLSDQIERLCSGVFPEREAAISRFLELDDRGRTSKREIYCRLLVENGAKDDALISELFNDYEQNAWRFARAFDGMIEMFNEIEQLGWKAGIVSNGRTHIQLRSVLALNLDRIVDVYLISETVGLRKPDPKIFLLAAHKLSVSPSRCVFVGDTPKTDIEGAQRVGMKAIWFPNGAQWPDELPSKPDAVIHSLRELSGELRHLSEVC